MVDITYNLKYNIEFIIKNNNINQSDFGKSIGSTQRQVSNWVTGKIRIPIEALVNIAAKYNYSIDELLFERLDDPYKKYEELHRMSDYTNLEIPKEKKNPVDKDEIIKLLREKVQLLEEKLPSIIQKSLAVPIDQINDLHVAHSRRELRENLEDGLKDANEAHRRENQKKG